MCTETGEQKYCSVQYIGEKISIGKEIGIEVKEVKTVAEAWKYFKAWDTEQRKNWSMD